MVNNAPNDAISSIRFNPSYDLFAISSWNNCILCYQYNNDDNNNNKIKTRCIGQEKHDRGVLCCCWDNTGSRIFSGSCDNTVRIWNVQRNGGSSNNNNNNNNKGKFITLGNHNAGVKCIEYASDFNILISGSWDRTLIYWDIRSGQKISTINLPAKVFCCGQNGNILVLGLSNKYVETYDLRNYKQHMNLEKTVLKHQLRCIDVFPDQRGYVCSSIEGRTAIKHFDKYDAKQNDFSFKCHRHQRGNDKHSQDVFAVNTLRFNKQFGTFATGGDDGQINIWDKEGRSRLKHFEQIKIQNNDDNNNNNNNSSLWGSNNNNNTSNSKVNNSFMPITSLDFNKNGRILGYTTSYNWNKGISFYQQNKQHPQIYLHNVQQKEVDANWNKGN